MVRSGLLGIIEIDGIEYDSVGEFLGTNGYKNHYASIYHMLKVIEVGESISIPLKRYDGSHNLVTMKKTNRFPE